MAQKGINDYKKDYESARARGDAAGMKAANDAANKIRDSLGQKRQYATGDISSVASQNKNRGSSSGGSSGSSNPGSWIGSGASSTNKTGGSKLNGSSLGSTVSSALGNLKNGMSSYKDAVSAGKNTAGSYSYTGTAGSTGSGTTNNGYTAKGTFNDSIVSAEHKKALESNSKGWAMAMARGDTKAAQEFHDDSERIRKIYGYSGGDDGSEYIQIGDNTQYEPWENMNTYEDFLNDTGYNNAIDAYKNYAQNNQAALAAAYGQQVQQANQAADDSSRQAYINYMLGQKNLPQQMAANGYTGGLADSQLIGMNANYQNNLTDIENNRQTTISGLLSSMVQAVNEGNMEAANKIASLLQNASDQYLSYANQQNSNKLSWDSLLKQIEQENKSLDYQNNALQISTALDLLNAYGYPVGNVSSILGTPANSKTLAMLQYLLGAQS